MAKQITIGYDEAVNDFALNGYERQPVAKEVRPAAVERWASMFAVENSLASFVAMNANKPSDITSEEMESFASGEYNPLEMVKGTAYDKPKYLPYVAKARSQRELNHLTRNIDRERRDRETIATMSTSESLLAGMVAGTLDPTFAPAMLIPGAFAATGTRFLATGATASGLAGVAEMSLHGTQAERDWRETVTNMSGAFLLAGVLGSALGAKFSPEQKAAWVKAIDDERSFVGPPVRGAGAGIGAEADIGVMKSIIAKDIRDDLTAQLDEGSISRDEYEMLLFIEFDEATKLKNSAIFSSLKIPEKVPWVGGVDVNLLRVAHPGLKLATSEMPQMRMGAMQLFEDAYLRGYNEKGLGLDAQPVTTRIKMSQDANGTMLIDETLQRNYAKYLDTEYKGQEDMLGLRSFSQMIARRKDKKDDFDMFGSRVMQAIMKGTDDDPNVKAAAQDIKTVLDRIDAERREVGLEANLKEGEEPGAKPLHGDEGYYPRVINIDELNSRGHDFDANVGGGFIDYVKLKYGDQYAEILEQGLEEDLASDLLNLATTYRKSVEKAPTGYVSSNGIKYPKDGQFAEFFKGKKIDVSSSVLMKHGFIYSDLKASMAAYLRNAVPEIEITRTFGDVKMKDFFDELDADFRVKLEADYEAKFDKAMDPDTPHVDEGGATTPETKFVRGKQQAYLREKDLLNNLRRYMLHEFERPDNPLSPMNGFLRKLKAWNVMTKLGAMTITSISDIGSAMMRVGFAPYGKTIAKFAMGFSASVPREQARKMGVGLDVIMNTRMNQIGMLDDAAGFTSADRKFDTATKAFSKMTGMAQWNAIMKQFAAMTIFDNMGQLARKGSRISAKDKRNLSRMGISEEHWKGMRKQIKTHGTKEGGWEIPNTEKWTDETLKDLYEGAVLRESDTAIVTPGPGDLPMTAYRPGLDMLYQFKTFMFAMQNKVVIPGVQQRDASTLLGAGSMIALGAASYAIKQSIAGNDISQISGDQWIKEGISRSGVTGMLWNADTLLHDMTGGEFSVQDMMFDSNLPVSRRMSESMISGLVGPWYGTLKDASSTMSLLAKGVTGGEILPEDVTSLRRMTPFQNLFYFRQAFDLAEEAAGGREIK